MDAKAFRAAVNRARPSGVSQAGQDAAIEYFVKTLSQTAQSDVPNCVQLAGQFDMWHASAQDAGQSSSKRLSPLTRGTLARGEELTTRITPDVEQLRQELFGSSQVPFGSVEEAAAWIRKAWKQQYDYSPEERQRLQELEKQIYTLSREWSRLKGASTTGYPGQPRYLRYIARENGELREIWDPVRGGFPLARLEAMSQCLAGITGFRPSSVVMYILTGTKPLLTPVQLDFMGYGDERLRGVQTTIVLHTPDVTDEQLREIRREIRAHWGVPRTKRLSEANSRLLAFVKDRGSVPTARGKNKAFWEKAYPEWRVRCEQEGHPSPITNAESMRETYRRLRKQVHRTTGDVDIIQWMMQWASEEGTA
jgi:hypothetical protein